MEQTFGNNLASAVDNAGDTSKDKLADNLSSIYAKENERIRANQSGEQNVGGSAGRAQAASLDPKDYDTRGGPGGSGPKPVQDPVL